MKVNITLAVLTFLILYLAPLLPAQIDSAAYLHYVDSLNTANNFNNAQAAPVDSSKLSLSQGVRDSLSGSPTLSEIIKLFMLSSEGKRDPFVAASEIALKNDNAIPALKTFLFTPADQLIDSTRVSKLKSSKKFAVYALREIFTEKSIQLLTGIIETHPDKEVRGVAVSSIAWNFFNRVKYDSLQPDKEIIHALLQSAGDTAFSGICESKIQDIAKQGIKNWMGIDYNNLLNTAAGTSLITSDIYTWWQNNSNKIMWNNNTKEFIVAVK